MNSDYSFPDLICDPPLDETIRHNEWILSELADVPDMWAAPPEVARQARREGKGIFPVQAEEPTARWLTIETSGVPVKLRHFSPKTLKPKGSFLHMHGGGWQIGSADGTDGRLQEMADRCALDCYSIEYRLAPEHPYPAGPDDCFAAAKWLIETTKNSAGHFLTIGGESAGAHLAASTLLRLRDELAEKGEVSPFDAAVLIAGVYDLGHSPSSRNWSGEKLILDSRDMRMFVEGYLQAGEDRRDPKISPLYSNLDGLPAAFFSVGTRDLLLDDTLSMATRWQMANRNARLEVVTQGCHVFQYFPDLEISRRSHERIDRFLTEAMDRKSGGK